MKLAMVVAFIMLAVSVTVNYFIDIPPSICVLIGFLFGFAVRCQIGH